MSLDKPPKNAMITTPPMKKEFHFAATAEHYAEVVYAATIQEAEEIYHKVKRLISPISIGLDSTAGMPSSDLPQQPTPAFVAEQPAPGQSTTTLSTPEPDAPAEE